MSTIQQAFKDGGGWMIPILIVSFIALAVVIE
jgi:hypothetical protein